MALNDVEYVLSSESSDDYYLNQFSTQAEGQKSQTLTTPSSGPIGSTPLAPEEEPDWVKNYTPSREREADHKAALLASIDDDDDDDSFIDLIPEGDDEKGKPTGRKHAQPEIDEVVAIDVDEDTKKESSQATARRARAASKPKSSLPLTVAPKLSDGLALLQSLDGGLDLSGDVGAVGRVKLDDGNLYLDIKGVVYRANAHPSNTMCVVTVGDDEAKITAVLDEAVMLTSERNLFASDEVMIHGELGEELDDNINESQSELEGKDDPAGTTAGENRRKKKAAESKSKGRPKSKAATKPKSGAIKKKISTKQPRKKK